MKKIFSTLLFVTLLTTPSIAFAQTPTPKEEKKSAAEVLNQVDQIKDKVASRVAELNLVEKRGVVGVVESVNGNEIRINDLNDKTRIIDVDELTKFTSDEGAFELEDIKKGTKISAIGLYNKDSGKLLARFVNEISIPLFLNGVISNKDDNNTTITLSTESEKDYTVEIENVTKSFTFSDGELESITFTKLPILKNALVIGYADPKSENTLTAGRIIIFPDVPKNPRVEIDETTIEPSQSASLSPTPTNEE